eukprot:NODE_16960_length_968_cov_4.971463.p1 GENE.NODE_16960_length_968_cov_4.971463~~NODE_16960_length_968_cov_4.971463.p1  ORF type:complete len:228 (+),score=65.64 NODE_16960_length_968_cov_4.971463:89-772(+)
MRRTASALAVVVVALLGILGPAAVADEPAPVGNVVKLTKFNFEDNTRDGVWFVKFYAPWCKHCKRIAPIWEKLADNAAEKEWPLRVAEVDCTEQRTICDKLQIKAIPALLMLDDGKMKKRYTGDMTLEKFEAWLSKLLNFDATGQAQAGAGAGAGSAQGAATGTRALAAHAERARASLAELSRTFPTSSPILNLYIGVGSSLLALLSCLCWCFGSVEEEQLREDKRQ